MQFSLINYEPRPVSAVVPKVPTKDQLIAKIMVDLGL